MGKPASKISLVGNNQGTVVADAWRIAGEVIGIGPNEVRACIGEPREHDFPSSLAPLIEQTLLTPTTTVNQIRAACDEVLEHGFHGVCVNPRWIATSRQFLAGSNVAIVSVVGFPLGANKSDIKAQEAQEAVTDGATELDMVGDLGSFRSGDYRSFLEDIRTVIDAVPQIPVKVIIECGLLADDLERSLAATLAALAGAAFVKTSTGFAYDRSGGVPRSLGATEEDVHLLSMSVGSLVGVKASGGIADYGAACRLVKAGATRIGTSSGAKLLGPSGV